MGLEFQQYACELCVGSSQGKSRQVKALGQEDWRTNSDFGHISGHIFVWCEMFLWVYTYFSRVDQEVFQWSCSP